MSKTTMSMTSLTQDGPASHPSTCHTAAPQPAAPMFSRASDFWLQNREASLNWLAFGLLLAAWNSAIDDSSSRSARPEALRGYSSVSVRAAQRSLIHVP